MRSGVILQIRDGKAVILDSSGRFATREAEPEWRAGQTVALEKKKPRALLTLSAAAACLILFFSAAGYQAFFTSVALVSLDVNPSIEIETNRFDRVVSVAAYNEEGGKILNDSHIRFKKLDEAINLLLESGMGEYLSRSPYIAFSVHTENDARMRNLTGLLGEAAEEITAVYPQVEDSNVEVYAVDEQCVEEAHGCHMTAGKYMELLRLEELNPDIDIEEYAHCGIGEIRQEIGHCENRKRNVGNSSCEEHHGHGHHG